MTSSKIPEAKPDDQAQADRQETYAAQRRAEHPPPEVPVADPVISAFLRMAVQEIGGALTDLGRVLLQGPSEFNEATRGNIALGLERAASYVRGKSFDKYPVGWDSDNGKTEKKTNPGS